MNRLWQAAACAAFGLIALAPAYAAKPKMHAAPGPAILAPAPPEAEGFSSERIQRLNDAMHRAVDDKQIAGIVTLLARHGRIVDFDSYGKQSLSSNTPIAKDTIFRMYSQTKPLTGAAMMILFEEGKWRLDDPVAKYVPELANLKVFAGLDKDGQPILEDAKHPPTMRELVTHTAGFGYGLANDNYVDQQFQSKHVLLESNSLQDLIDRVATIPLRYQPGTKWSYSIAVDIQGYIIEKLSGQSLGDFMQSRMFAPLGMKDTGFWVRPGSTQRLSAAFTWNPATNSLDETPTGATIQVAQFSAALPDYTKPPKADAGGEGSLSTAADYARFCQMMLNHGELGDARILSPAAVSLLESDLLEDTVAGGVHEFGGGTLGFGVDVAIDRNPAKLGSLEGSGSFSWGGAAGTWFWIDPKNDLFFIGLIQRFRNSPGNEHLNSLSNALVYSALVDPGK
ncbi:MAG: serine hydrolase domain-containing protein [Rhizomicrobium sp.]|jgi:CubicO group peptidase (beta-lactamase class C family)